MAKIVKPYTSAFDGSDTQEAVRAFLEKGGKIMKCNKHSKATGDIRFQMNPTRKKDS